MYINFIKSSSSNHWIKINFDSKWTLSSKMLSCNFFKKIIVFRIAKGYHQTFSLLHIIILIIHHLFWWKMVHRRNPSFGLATKAKGLQGCGPRGSPGVTSETLGSVGECEGVSLHTPKATPKLGEGVPVDSWNFRERFEGSNLNGLLRSLYQWKALEA